MKQKMLEWAFEFLLTKDVAKKLVHAINRKLQEKAALPDGKQKIAGYLRDGMATLAAYSAAVSDDGRICDEELATINATTDALIDAYIK